MQSGGILSPENLAAIFLNLQVAKIVKGALQIRSNFLVAKLPCMISVLLFKIAHNFNSSTSNY